MIIRFAAEGLDPPFATPTIPLAARNQNVSPSPSSTSVETSLPASTILSLGLGFIGAALLAIGASVLLRFYYYTRVYPARTGHPYTPRRPGANNGERGFRAWFADWWSTFWAGPGPEFWETRYIVKRRQPRPEMWEVLLDEKDGGPHGRTSRASCDTSNEKAPLDSHERDPGRSPGVKLIHISEEEDALGDSWQPLAVSPVHHTSVQGRRPSAAGSAHEPIIPGRGSTSTRRRSSGDEIAISVLLLMPSPGEEGDLPDLALGTAYLTPAEPLPELGHVTSRATLPPGEDNNDDLVVEVIHTQPRYPQTFADLAMVRF